MNDICRLCLSVCPQVTCELSEECDILRKLWSCLSVQICIINNLPNQVCGSCIQKIEDIQNFHRKITENQNTLLHYLLKGNEDLNNFYLNLKPKLNIKEENNRISLTENKENDKNISIFNNIKQESVTNFEVTIDYSSEDDLVLSSIKTAKESTVSVKKTIHATEHKTEEISSTLAKQADCTADTENKIKTECVSQNIPLNINVKHKCLTCFELLVTQNDLLRHYNTKHGLESVASKEKTTELAKYTVVTSDEGNVTFKCSECDRLYGDKRTITRHVMTHSECRPFICKMCGRTYKTASEIIRHGRAHSGFKLDCSYQCGYSTVYMGALKEHERRHRTEFKYKCEKCGKGFQVKTWFLEHQNIHNGVKPFVCSICGLAFHMNRYLTAHRSTVHPQSSSVKRYVCVLCSLPCDSRNALTEHLKEHGIKTSFLCDICGKTLSNSEQLKFHKRMHQGIKPYTCSTCNKSFAKKFNLTVHARAHSGERAHACAACARRYTQRSALLRHIARHHAAGSPQKCTKCQKSFTTRSQLASHERMCL